MAAVKKNPPELTPEQALAEQAREADRKGTAQTGGN